MTETIEETTPGTLAVGEFHPAATSAYTYVKSKMKSLVKLALVRESLASNALSGNRLAEVCLETLERIIEKKPISDRYLLGLAWMMKLMEEENGRRHTSNDK